MGPTLAGGAGGVTGWSAKLWITAGLWTGRDLEALGSGVLSGVGASLPRFRSRSRTESAAVDQNVWNNARQPPTTGSSTEVRARSSDRPTPGFGRSV